MNRFFKALNFRVIYLASQSEKMVQFTDALTKQELEKKNKQISKGRAWRADELRLKSTEDLHKLWFFQSFYSIRYVLLMEKNLLLSDGIMNLHLIGSIGRQGKLISVKKSMGRLLTIIGEREKVKKDYLKHLEDEYVKQKTEEYYKDLENNQQIVPPQITPNLLRAKIRDLKKGKDDISYIEEAVKIQQKKDNFKQYLKQQYNYAKKEVIPQNQDLKQGQTEEDVIRQFKSTVHQQILQAIKIPQEEVLRKHNNSQFHKREKSKGMLKRILKRIRFIGIENCI
ncbi:39S ribosomal protein L47 [Paramecium bursaria]